MTSHTIETRDVQRAFRIAECHVMAGIFAPRPSEVRPRCLKMLRAALSLAYPAMDEDELGLVMSMDDGEPVDLRPYRQIPLWWSDEVVARMAAVLNLDWVRPKPKRQPKPLPADLDLTGLPLCGPKRPHTVEVVRRPMVVREARPLRVATPWNPPEAHAPHPERPRRTIPLGEPAYERSALYERRLAAGEVRA